MQLLSTLYIYAGAYHSDSHLLFYKTAAENIQWELSYLKKFHLSIILLKTMLWFEMFIVTLHPPYKKNFEHEYHNSFCTSYLPISRYYDKILNRYLKSMKELWLSVLSHPMSKNNHMSIDNFNNPEHKYVHISPNQFMLT